LRLRKLALFAIYRVVNTTIYNLGNKNDGGHSEQGGILVSPVKFKNFEPQIAIATEQYIHVFEAPITNSENEREQTRQDGARKILELVTHRFLSQLELESWQNDPEYFIENEDEHFLLEYDLEADCSINLLALHLIEKLL
jgi:hypothetical protein